GLRGPGHQGGADPEAGRPREALRAGAGGLQGRGAVDHAGALDPLRPGAQGSEGLQDGRDRAPLLRQGRHRASAVTLGSAGIAPAMLAFIPRRAALIVPPFSGVTLLAFALIHLIPGDPVENLSGERGMDPARRERLLHQFGLDRPLPVQYGEYIG